MALTTLQFWQQQLAIHLAAQAAAQSDLTAAQTLQKDSAGALTADLKALDAGAAKIAAQRAQLAVTSIPAEASALIALITKGVIAQRKLQGTMLDDQAKLADAGAQVDAANAVLARSKSRVAAVQAAITTAGIDGKQRDMLRTVIAAPPLLTIAADATSLLGSTTAANAKTRLDANFPTAMQSIAQKRYATRNDRLTSLQTVLAAAQDALATDLAADNGLSGAVKKAWLGLQRAQAALADQVATAAARYAKAQTLLQKLEAIQLAPAGTVPDVLTDAEKALCTTLDAKGAAAEPTAEALDTDLLAVFVAQDAVDTAILDQITSDVDQLPTSASVAAKRADVGTAQTAFDTALANFAGANESDLHQWEAVIPDPAWNFLLDYDDGLAALDALKAINLQALASAMDKAEDTYTTALAAAEKAQRRADALADALARREARLAASQAAIGSRLPSAIRGDTY
jgi:hypothetical protein